MTKKNQRKKNALVLQHFDINYGVDETKLQGWQRLCEDVGVAARGSIKQCKKASKQALKTVNVNIHDLVDAKKAGQTPRHFPNRRALSNYIVEKRRWFSKVEAKKNGYLAALLIEVWA
ncbi:hypothetical protein B0A50_01892 [Salinomyces thailandicus]|uniref:Uncharacterized protein n=1 Tax=Salinomyces thailandicus TaxID=706561 RepID=A0A4U0U911_9PEZI|nr:hypothetical protein B0A50_01892 [Salinomyces thailandica]